MPKHTWRRPPCGGAATPWRGGMRPHIASWLSRRLPRQPGQHGLWPNWELSVRRTLRAGASGNPVEMPAVIELTKCHSTCIQNHLRTGGRSVSASLPHAASAGAVESGDETALRSGCVVSHMSRHMVQVPVPSPLEERGGRRKECVPVSRRGVERHSLTLTSVSTARK